MSEKTSPFKLMKLGYDRFAVDNEIENYQRRIDELKKQTDSYQLQIKKMNEEFELIKIQHEELSSGLQGKEKAADEIARLALREANYIVETAQRNADSIINEALTTAKLILVEVTNLSNSVEDKKDVMLKQISELKKSIEEFEPADIPAMRHINN